MACVSAALQLPAFLISGPTRKRSRQHPVGRCAGSGQIARDRAADAPAQLPLRARCGRRRADESPPRAACADRRRCGARLRSMPALRQAEFGEPVGSQIRIGFDRFDGLPHDVKCAVRPAHRNARSVRGSRDYSRGRFTSEPSRRIEFDLVHRVDQFRRVEAARACQCERKQMHLVVGHLGPHARGAGRQSALATIRESAGCPAASACSRSSRK